MIYQLKPNQNSLGRRMAEPEAVDICQGASVWASVHVDAFYDGPQSGQDENSIYSRLRRGEEVEVTIEATREEATR